jgi:phosphatidylglycerol:prolipoprotein diacylglycerol transferase
MVCDFSGIAFYAFGFPIHWYSLAYIFGLVIALKLTEFFGTISGASDQKNFKVNQNNFLNYAIIGIIVGGRLGHVLFYDFGYFSTHCTEILKIWKGGMSFFGGFTGVVCSAYLFCKKQKIDFFEFIDLWSISVPIGLFLGRITNFLNGELLGTPSDVPWHVIFNDGITRHPSQIYEAILEGILLFLVMLFSFHKKNYKRRGVLSGIFCIGYGVARFIGEFFREPDSTFSYKLLYYTCLNFNQYLSILIITLGIVLTRLRFNK